MPDFDERLEALVQSALREDLGDGDHTTQACIDPEALGRAELKIKEAGILAGVEVAQKIFALYDPQARVTIHRLDGQTMQAGQTAFEVRSRISTILSCERLVLNCMQRMSGIATLTREYTNRLQGYHTRLLDTRKTTPNFRLLEKEAVRIGGGHNHRFGLFDMILIKDNHIDYCGGIEKAIQKASRYVSDKKPGLKIEVETRSLEEVRRVLAVGGVDRIMLDNFSPGLLREALELIAGRYETEASGGIHLENLEQFAATGVDFISSGAVTHQARSLDLSLKASMIQ
ncbi:MAG: carboxylating nicotinate-nucleotide diphosphorylase [Bacteroidota bacterium]|nr:carboxylating nicotinate-nucleotide diphosphorylase [Bacteroidota bacterium]